MKIVKPQLKKLLNLNRKTIIFIVVLIILAATIISSLYFYLKYQDYKKLLGTNPANNSRQEVEGVIEAVGKLIDLPKGEEPTIATVSDKTKLTGQPFFKNAQNGDKVLIYKNDKKAIIYRPSINKIIEVASVNIDADTAAVSNPTPAVSVTQAPKVYKVVLLNGTKTVGLTKAVSSELESKTKEFTVVDRDNASKDDYKSTIVIDLTGTKNAAAEDLAALVNGVVGELPSGETKPSDADFLVILGSDTAE